MFVSQGRISTCSVIGCSTLALSCAIGHWLWSEFSKFTAVLNRKMCTILKKKLKTIIHSSSNVGHIRRCKPRLTRSRGTRILEKAGNPEISSSHRRKLWVSQKIFSAHGTNRERTDSRRVHSLERTKNRRR